MYSRNQLLKVKNLISPALIDQIPILYELKNYLERLSMINSKTQSNFSSVRVVSHTSLHDQISKEIEEWRFDLECLGIEMKCEEYKKLVDNLMEMYMDQMELSQKKLVKEKLAKEGSSKKEEKSYCAKCKKEASKRCSECKKYFYCSKKCQKKDLKSDHKNECKVHYEYVQKCIDLLKKKRRAKQEKKQKKEPTVKKETGEVKRVEKPKLVESDNVFSEMKSAILLGRKNCRNVFEKLNQMKDQTKSNQESIQIKASAETDMDELD
jgi:endogenous inhibitor of DNA gyrase (YacG/DUF329 family)